MTAISLDRTVNEILSDSWDALHAKLDGLGAPAPLSAALIDYDLNQGVVRFRWDNGAQRKASAHLVGVAQPEPGGPPQARFFKWGWDEAGLPESRREPALRLLALGREKGWEEVTSPMVRMHVDRIWAFCGLATILTGAAGSVLSYTQGREVFLTIGPLQIDS